MERNHLQAVLIALCVLAVIFGASLFPATGFGSYPAGPGGGSHADNPSGPTVGSRSDADVRSTSDEGTVAVTTAQPSSDGESSDEPAASSTTTPTTTAAAGADEGSSSNDGLLSLVQQVIGVLLVFGVVILGIGLRFGTVEFGGPGTIPITVRGVPIGELVGKIPARTMGLVVGFSASIPRLADDAVGLLAEVGRGLSAGTVGLGSAIAETVVIMGRGFGGTVLAIGSVGSGLFSIPNVLSRPTLGRSGRTSSRETKTANRAPTEPEERGPPTIEEAWEAMTSHLPIRHRRTTTPAEYAREAMKRGYPADAVRRLTNVFREVRYGNFPANEERTKLARAALDEIDRFREGDG